MKSPRVLGLYPLLEKYTVCFILNLASLSAVFWFRDNDRGRDLELSASFLDDNCISLACMN